MPEQTMGSSIFVALADLVSKIRAGGTEIRTAEFLDVCRQIIPVLGPCLYSAVIASSHRPSPDTPLSSSF